ncbi:MAG: HD domain-containing protein [Blautia sp.]|nr:HD domain-containing protein [Blautia sp.]
MRMNLPAPVNRVIHTLQGAGYDAYAVGGCVRDTLLGREPGDWDITTSAAPEVVKSLFPHTIDTGIQHGTVTVMLEHVGYEVTTYRIDGEYEDCRHPSGVTFTDNLLEDLKRRDFTINAMAYNDDRGLVDAFDGAGDLARGRIRCVGEAKARFSEDALRMLRAVRFAAQLDFSIEEETAEAVRELAPSIGRVSAERIRMELIKLLVSEHPDALRTAWELGLTAVFLPEFDRMMDTPQHTKHHCYSVGEHTLHTLSHVPADRVLRLAMLLHDVAKPVCISEDEEGEHFYGHPQLGADMAKDILRRLKLDNDCIRRVCGLIRWHDERPPLTERSVRRFVSKVGPENVPELLAVKRADILGQSMYRRQEKLEYVGQLEQLYVRMQKQNQCLKKSELAVNGRDLMAIGIAPGPGLGEVLDKLFSQVLDDPALNTREKLLALAHNFANPSI